MATVYEFGPFRLDPERGVLLRLGVAEPLGKRAVRILATLVMNARTPVTKDAIIDAAWPGRVVEEANLTVQMTTIRRVLSQTPGGERWIETLAGRGYRYVGPVTEVRDGVAYESQHARIGNLPASLASFVGREHELVELKRLLAKSRLLTLVGAGGIGKTRLAVQLAAEVADAYRDGVWFIDLAPLDDGALVPSAMAQVLDVHHSPEKSLTDALCRRLRGKRALLVVDNCEHVVDTSAQLIEALLRGANEPAIVATSREPLRSEGEQIYWLQSLPLPDPAADLEAIRHSDAVTLFVDRAQHQDPTFALTEAIARGVASLCVQLDGIPLALELAAPLVHTCSIDEINARLAARFDALTEGLRTALPRHQTLRATLDWSYGLLTEAERKVLRQLSLFRGGFTLGAATDVVADDMLQSSRVEDLIMRLATRSMLILDPIGIEARWRLLDTTRAYGSEKLDEMGEAADTHRRHAEHFRNLFDAANPAWLRIGDEEWRSRYLPEVDNVRIALDWALGANGDATLAIALAGGSGPVWTSLSLYAEGITRLETAAARLPSFASFSEQARLWLWIGLLVEFTAPARAIVALQRAVQLYRQIGDVEGVAQSAIWLSRPLALSGRCDEAAKALQTSLPSLKRSRLPKLRAFYYANAASLKALENDFAGAQSLYKRALALYREIGSVVGTAGSLNNVANASWALGDLGGAEAAFREAAVMHRQSGHRGRDPLGFALINRAGVLAERGKIHEALEVAREGVPLLHGTGNVWWVIDHLALRCAFAGKLANAAKVAGFADAAYGAKEVGRQPNEARARTRVHAVLHERLGPAKLETLLAEGARLTEEEACRLALDD